MEQKQFTIFFNSIVKFKFYFKVRFYLFIKVLFFFLLKFVMYFANLGQISHIHNIDFYRYISVICPLLKYVLLKIIILFDYISGLYSTNMYSYHSHLCNDHQDSFGDNRSHNKQTLLRVVYPSKKERKAIRILRKRQG